jgi:hypothetical protein
MSGSPFACSNKQKLSWGFVHLFRPTYPDFLHGAPPTAACAAFIKESRMKLTSATNLDRKSGAAQWRALRFLLQILAQTL